MVLAERSHCANLNSANVWDLAFSMQSSTSLYVKVFVYFSHKGFNAADSGSVARAMQEYSLVPKVPRDTCKAS